MDPMDLPTDQVSAPTDTDRLIDALQTCFTDLARKQEEQGARLQEAIEGLKPKVVTTDKKTRFWNAYKTLADEHDQELLQKYGTELDTSLLFSGLFSAVSSAFIIQVQPELAPHNPPVLVLVAQCLLYISLSLTLLAALLAVLGKQWLMYYSAAGERGTIEVRGLERQRKLDGLRRWKFDLIMQTFPLLLQLGLLLFAVALSIYLWTVHLAPALIVLCFTSLGCISYTALLISSVAAPDSPFQTPLSPIVARLLQTAMWRRIISGLTWIHQHIHFSFNWDTPPHLPLFIEPAIQTPGTSGVGPLFNLRLPPPSPEVPAVSWVLATSTEPHVVTTAAEIAVDLQWPVPGSIDVRLQISKIEDALLSCFNYHVGYEGEIVIETTRDSIKALHLGRAYCVLRCFLREQEKKTFIYKARLEKEDELSNMLRILKENPHLSIDPNQPLPMEWALRVVPSFKYQDSNSGLEALSQFLALFKDATPRLSRSAFTDFLTCICSFISAVSAVDMVQRDNSSNFLHIYSKSLRPRSDHLKSHWRLLGISCKSPVNWTKLEAGFGTTTLAGMI
ncbi:hypothetical protein C8R46DRAFT_439593 [Mycena filopes]|nr:hypothetical protein C8R46DRAFT_439593 [Mycena filopes]